MKKSQKKETFLDAFFRELPHSTLSMEDLAESCNMDYSYCCKIVKQLAAAIGMESKEFIAQVRSGNEPTPISLEEHKPADDTIAEDLSKRKRRTDISASKKLLYDNFFSYKEQGLLVTDMAKLHSVDPSTVYDVMHQIAEDQNIPYDTVLICPSKSHHTPKTTNSGYTLPKMVDISAICAKFDAVLNCIAETRAEIKTVFITEEKEKN